MDPDRCTDSTDLFLLSAVALAHLDGKTPVPDGVFGALMWLVDVKGGACGRSSFWSWRRAVLGARQAAPCADDEEPGCCSAVAVEVCRGI